MTLNLLNLYYYNIDRPNSVNVCEFALNLKCALHGDRLMAAGTKKLVRTVGVPSSAATKVSFCGRVAERPSTPHKIHNPHSGTAPFCSARCQRDE